MDMRRRRRRSRIVIIFFFFLSLITATCEEEDHVDNTKEKIIVQVKSEPEDVVWVVQLSDLHLSVHHPQRSIDFNSIVGPTLSFINPSLVLITGDLTDATSNDLLTMKQNEKEWIEYQQVMEETVRKSGLDKSIFYDMRGNHDNFGVPSFGSSSDFFSTYSLSAQLNRTELVNSIVIQTGEREILFVGFDSTTTPGLRGPTNLFGHPTDQLVSQVSSALSHQDTLSKKPVTKIAFGHFTLSFSAASSSGKTLKDIFLANSLSAYICGHLHIEYGPNLKRHHKSSNQHWYSLESVQLYPISVPLDGLKNCSDRLATSNEFWEWEMGDWREHRTMRILVVDRGHISFTDVNFQVGAKKTIIVPTFPLDSRFLPSSYLKEKCQSSDHSFGETIRTLVFSTSPIVSVVAKIYDSKSGNPVIVMETAMRKLESVSARGDIYSIPWNSKAFEDPSPLRYWFQVEAIDDSGEITLSGLRPFAVNGLNAKFSWTWKEFYLMGCHWSELYMPALWLIYCHTLAMIIIPKILLTISGKQYSYRNLCASKGIKNCMAWIFTEFYKFPAAWCGILAYVFYLMLFPWFYGQVFTDDKERGYMTSRGWVLKPEKMGETEFLGFPDILVVVMPHLNYVVSPAILVIMAFTVESGIYHDHILRLFEKKEDDHLDEISVSYKHSKISRLRPVSGFRGMRKLLLVATLTICWEHFKQCRDLVKAYEMNLILDFPVYSLAIPLLIAHAFYKTGKMCGVAAN